MNLLSKVNFIETESKMGYLSLSLLKKSLLKYKEQGKPVKLICLENPQRYGKVVSLDFMKSIRELSEKFELPVYLDGSRVFSAALALGVEVKELAQYVDSLM
ncbi:L-allo-threonine aldolase [compost metagenome]